MIRSHAAGWALLVAVAGCDTGSSVLPPEHATDPPLPTLVPVAGTAAFGTVVVAEEECAITAVDGVTYRTLRPATVEVEWSLESRTFDPELLVLAAGRESDEVPVGETRGFFRLHHFDVSVQDTPPGTICTIVCNDEVQSGYAIDVGLVTEAELSEVELTVEDAKRVLEETVASRDPQGLAGCAAFQRF